MEALADNAFRWAAEEDSLCEENVRGIESDLAEATFAPMPIGVVRAGSCRSLTEPALQRN